MCILGRAERCKIRVPGGYGGGVGGVLQGGGGVELSVARSAYRVLANSESAGKGLRMRKSGKECSGCAWRWRGRIGGGGLGLELGFDASTTVRALRSKLRVVSVRVGGWGRPGWGV